MNEITSCADILSRSQFYAFEEAYPLPSGCEPYLYSTVFHTMPTYHDVAIDVLLTGLMDADGEPRIGIRGYMQELDDNVDILYVLDCDCEDDLAEEDWIIDVFNGVVEELDSTMLDDISTVDAIFEKWGILPR